MNWLSPTLIAAIALLASISLAGPDTRVAAAQQGWEAARHLARGVRIQSGDLQPVSLGPRNRNGTLSGSEQSLIGMRTRRSLAAGTVVRSHFLERPPLVERGDAVTLRIIRGSLVIEARGQAKTSGNLGDSIRVENTDSRKIVTGRVSEDGSVHVSF